MSIGWQTGLILGALGLSLILNVVALIRISDLRDEVVQLRGQTTEISNLRSDLRHTQYRMDELEEAQQLVTGLEWSIDPDEVPEGCDGDLPVTASWTFREVAAEADVYLDVRRPGDDWIRAESEAVSDLEFQATSELSAGWEWEYRIVAESDGDTRMHGPEPLAEELDDLTDRRIRVEEGEVESRNGEAWFRFVALPTAEHQSACNEVVAATLNLSDDNELIESVDMQPGYPGPHRPENGDWEAEEPNHSAADDTTEADTAVPYVYEANAWWSDWVRTHDSYDVEVVVEFVDGTERTQPHPLNMLPTR